MSTNSIFSYRVISNLSKRSFKSLIYPINGIIQNFLIDVILFNKKNRVYNSLSANLHDALVYTEVIKKENPYFVPNTEEHRWIMSLIKDANYLEFFISRKRNKIFIEFNIKGSSRCWEYKIERTEKGISLVYVK